jgi:putative transposase
MKALAIGGTSDHVHVLLSLPATLSVAKAMQLLKGNSSKWLRETFPRMHSFAWQEGYGAFSIAVSGVDATVAYIRNQAEHHRRRSFGEEYLAVLKKHGFAYDESMLARGGLPSLAGLGYCESVFPALKRWAIWCVIY